MALTGNPIKLSINSSSLATYTILVGEQTIFTGSGESNFFVFIQDILADIVQPAQLYNESEEVLLQAEGCSHNVTINVSNSEKNSLTISLKVFIGGISKRMLRHLNDENKNVFIWKLMNPEGNFFQTTRTSERLITIRETELLPISFIYPDSGILRVIANGIETVLIGVAGEPVGLNLYRLRKQLFDAHHILASIFDIYVGETKSCTIVITPGTISRERYLLQFLNSYGSYELIEITGIGNIKREAEKENAFNKYDEVIDDYVESWERLSGRESMTVESGYRTNDELIHLIDMLSSDDIKLLGLDGRNIRVNVTAENLTRASRATVPESIKLSLRFADSEQRYTGSFTDDDLGSPRIHTEQFTKQFN
nr:MAG TPA: hypothetical protein [Siphoviridae sp. ctEfY6]